MDRATKVFLLIITIIIIIFAGLSIRRNKVYATDVTFWIDVTEKSPFRARCWNNLGTSLYMEGNETLAFEAYKRAYELNPDDPEVNNNMGYYCFENNDILGAERHLRKACEIDNQNTNTMSNLAVIIALKGDSHESMELFLKAIKTAAYNNDTFSLKFHVDSFNMVVNELIQPHSLAEEYRNKILEIIKDKGVKHDSQ